MFLHTFICECAKKIVTLHKLSQVCAILFYKQNLIEQIY